MTAKERLEKLYENELGVNRIDYELQIIQRQREELDKKEYKLKEERNEKVLENKATRETVEFMKTSIYREILKRHYYSENGRQTWEAVAEAIGYSTIQVYNYRSLALEEFEKTWENKKT